MDWTEVKNKMAALLADGGIRLLEVIGVLILGIIVIKLILKVTKKLLNKTKIDVVAQRFIANVAKFMLYLLLIIAIAQIIGIPMTGFIAILSAAGLAVSLALQGSLSNLANGVVIIITKPFKEGDFVKINGNEGKVKEIKMLHTILLTSDNKQISIPNKTVVENDITNYNGNITRKVVFNFSVAYASDVNTVKKIIMAVIKSCPKTLDEPEPFVALKTLNSSSIDFTANCWCRAEDYWDVYYAITEGVFNEFKRNSIDIPYNQIEVRMHEGNEVLPFNEEPLQERTVRNVIKEKKKKEDDGLLFGKKFWGKKEDKNKDSNVSKENNKKQKDKKVENKKPTNKNEKSDSKK